MKTLVLGVGNRLFRDEGVGCHLADELHRHSLPGVEVLDWGTCPDPPPDLADATAVLVLDACDAGSQAGNVYRLTPEDLSTPPYHLSFHDRSLIDNLPILASLYGIRRVVIIGIQCAALGPGLELSADLKGQLPSLVRTITKEIHTIQKAVEEEDAHTAAKAA
ncbi:MAG: hydrogenase maturation protease [Chloroflexota bacterium]